MPTACSWSVRRKPKRETKRELDEPGALSESLRKMGLM